jgi:hypothetical protein
MKTLIFCLSALLIISCQKEQVAPGSNTVQLKSGDPVSWSDIIMQSTNTPAQNFNLDLTSSVYTIHVDDDEFATGRFDIYMGAGVGYDTRTYIPSATTNDFSSITQNNGTTTLIVAGQGALNIIDSRPLKKGIQYMGDDYEGSDQSLTSRKYVDNKKSELKLLTSDPAGKPDGFIYYNTSTNKMRIKANGVWFSIVTE